MELQEYDEQFPFAGRDWPEASFIDVWNGVGPYMKSQQMLLCRSDPPPAWNVNWTRRNNNPKLAKELLFPASYAYCYAFYHNFTGNQNPGKAQSMPLAAVLFPAQKAIFECAA